MSDQPWYMDPKFKGGEMVPKAVLDELRRRVLMGCKHGPLGRGGPGRCDANCAKCYAESIDGGMVSNVPTPEEVTRGVTEDLRWGDLLRKAEERAKNAETEADQRKAAMAAQKIAVGAALEELQHHEALIDVQQAISVLKHAFGMEGA